MKNLKYLAAGMLLLSLAFCKSKKSAEATASASEGFVPSDKQMEVAQKRWGNVLAAELKEGQAIYTTRCTACHKAFEITQFSEKKWLHEIDDMSPKAKLTAEEKSKLTKHILSYREAHTVVKAN